MFEHRYGIKLKQTHDYIFLSDMEKYDGERRITKLLREFDKAGMETELFEESISLWVR